MVVQCSGVQTATIIEKSVGIMGVIHPSLKISMFCALSQNNQHLGINNISFFKKDVDDFEIQHKRANFWVGGAAPP